MVPRGPVEYDLVVVGARVAGSTLAALVGAAGYRVLLVDRAPFPSPTLSTHFFRGARGVGMLRRLGVLDTVLALGCPPLTREYRYLDGAPAPAIEPPQDPGDLGYCLSVRRAPLDHILAAHAGALPAVDFHPRTRVAALTWADGRVNGARLAAPAGERVVRARCVVGADGRHSFVARAVAAPVATAEAGHRGMYYAYVRGMPGPHGGDPDGPEFARLGDEQAYLFPSDDGLACLVLSLNLPDYARLRRNPEEHFRARIMARPGWATRFAAATRQGRLLGCGPTPNYVRVPVGPGWALVGDAGMHQDPWSGIGIDKACVHAGLLAEELVRWFAGSVPEGQALASYHQRRDADGLASYRLTVARSRDLRPAPTT